MNMHASCVAFGETAALITGASGAGKSSLALDLVSRGGTLVADDRVDLWRADDAVIASAPPELAGLIEARGVGILRLPHQAQARVAVIVDLDRAEEQRLPPMRTQALLNVNIPLIFMKQNIHAAAAIAALMRAGGARAAP